MTSTPLGALKFGDVPRLGDNGQIDNEAMEYVRLYIETTGDLFPGQHTIDRHRNEELTDYIARTFGFSATLLLPDSPLEYEHRRFCLDAMRDVHKTLLDVPRPPVFYISDIEDDLARRMKDSSTREVFEPLLGMPTRPPYPVCLFVYDMGKAEPPIDDFHIAILTIDTDQNRIVMIPYVTGITEKGRSVVVTPGLAILRYD